MTVHGQAITDKVMDNIASYMRDDIREDLHNDLAPCSHETFIRAYLDRDPDFINLLKSEFSFKE